MNIATQHSYIVRKPSLASHSSNLHKFFRYDCEEHNTVFDGDNYAADDSSYKKKEAQLPKKLVFF